MLHSPEFKREAVALVQEQGFSCASAGRSLGISGALIGCWMDELKSHAMGAFPAMDSAQPSNNASMSLNVKTGGCKWNENS